MTRLLYEPSAIPKLQERAETIEDSPAQKAGLVEWVRQRREQLELEKVEQKAAANLGTRDVTAILTKIQAGAEALEASAIVQPRSARREKPTARRR